MEKYQTPYSGNSSTDQAAEAALPSAWDKWKPYITGAVIVIFLASALGGSIYLNKKRGEDKQKNGVELTEDGKAALEAQYKDLQDQLDRLPDNAPADQQFQVYYKLAEVKYLLGDYNDALNFLDKVKRDNQNNASMHALYANIFKAMGQEKQAKDSAKRALDLDDKNPQAWVAYINFMDGQSPEVIKSAYQDALNKTGNNVGIITAYAQFLEKIGDKKGAIEQWQNAITAFPQGKQTYDGEIARLKQ